MPSCRFIIFPGPSLAAASLISTEAARECFVPIGRDTCLLSSDRAFGQPLQPIEDLISTLITLGGLTLLAFLFASVAAALKVQSQVAQARRRALERLKEEMLVATIPPDLERKVLATYDHVSRYGAVDNGILRDPTLSLDLRREIALAMYGSALKRVPIFDDVPTCFLKCLSQMIQVRLYTPGDLLLMYGELGKELFIIANGVAQPITPEGHPIGDVMLKKGSYCGELCFLNPGARRNASVICLEFCTALMLTVEAFMELALEGVLRELKRRSEVYYSSGNTLP